MARYIDVDELLAKIDDKIFETNPKGEEQIGFLKCRKIVREQPAADVRPERHGRWIKDGSVLICSGCGEEHAWDDYRATYCEDCGAKMDGNSGESDV